MPKQVSKSGLFAKLGTKLATAHEKHKADDTTFGQMNLPAGIENGIAQLVDCKFTKIADGKQNAGEFMFYAAGIVLSPHEFQGTPIVGLRTNISEPLFDTPSRSRKTIEDHYGWILNELRKLGVKTDEVNYESIEAVCEALKQEKPVFRFRTWKGEPAKEGKYKGKDPMTNHQWNGVIVNYEKQADESPNGDGAVEDSHEEEATTTTEGESEEEETTAEGEEATTEGEEEQGEAPSAEKLEALVKQANKKDSDAQQELTDLATAAGITEEAVGDAASWEALRDLILEATASSSEEEGEEETTEEEEVEEPASPEKGDIVQYRPLDPKTKKPGKKAVKAEIVKVDTKSSTVDLKRSDTKALVKGVKWDKLEPA